MISAYQPELFDLVELARVEAIAIPWSGAPLTYTTDYYPPSELLAAFDRWVLEHGNFGCLAKSHMWHTSLTFIAPPIENGHAMVLLSATGCCDEENHDHHGVEIPDELMYQSICEPCGWHSIHDDENAAVEAWHDHALPGWRTLPVLPAKFARAETRQQKAAALVWIEANYPAEWLIPGAPVRTQREPYGTRHVSGRSPLGGYDLGIPPTHN